MEVEGYAGIVPLGFYENQLLGSNGMPLGFRFHPTDQELISFFLYNRVFHREYCKSLIYEFDLFGKTPPWVVWENFGGPGLEDQDLYFFCQLKTRSQTRIKREIDAGGTWSESNSKPVKDLQNEKAFGKKRNLLYEKEDQDLYFFCQLKTRSQTRIKREIDAGGTWSESNSKPVKDVQNEKAIGKKRNLRYEKEGCEHDGDWLLEGYSILPSVFGGADDSDHEFGKVVLCRLKKNSRSGNKKNCSNSTQQVNDQPAKKRARKEVKEKPEKKRARKEASEKPAKTKARNKVPSPNTTSMITHTIEELQNCPSTSTAPVLPFDESNYKMISDAINHDQQCISNFDGSTMPANFSDHDYVPISFVSEGDELLLKDEDLLFDNGEDMFLDLDDLSAPLDCESAWSQEKLLQIDENQVPLPLDGMNCWDDYLWMGNFVQ